MFRHNMYDAQLKLYLRVCGLERSRWSRDAMECHLAGKWVSPYMAYINRVKMEVGMVAGPRSKRHMELVPDQSCSGKSGTLSQPDQSCSGKSVKLPSLINPARANQAPLHSLINPAQENQASLPSLINPAQANQASLPA